MVHENGPPVSDPRELLREHQAPAPQPVPAAQRVERLLEQEGNWLAERIRVAADRFGLDSEELFQEVVVSLLRRESYADLQNRGLHTWLGDRVDWTAYDLLRKRNRTVPVTDRPDALDRLADPSSGGPPSPTLNPQDLERLGLTTNEAQTVAFHCTGTDMPLKDLALLVGRSYAAVRKEKQRGLKKLENLFDLTDEETEVVRAWRRHGTAAAAAPHVGRPIADFLRILDNVHKKTDRVFDEKEGRP